MAYLLILFPLAMAALTFAAPSDRFRSWLIPVGSLGHLVLTWVAVFGSAEPVTAMDGWLLLDSLGKVVLGFQSVLFFLCALYAPGYLALRSDRPSRVFCANLFAVLAMMTLVSLSHHLGLMWVGMEATTLASAPLLYFNHNPRSLEATWKYLLIGSVGIALALFGSFFLAYSALKAGLESTLLFDDLVREAPQLSVPWLHAAFVLLFIGYGTKMGLAPMHTWKPDAYGEAPGIVGTLLAGGVTSCAFLAVLRVYQICRASPEEAFAREVMIFMGLLSMAFGAVFMVRQRDFKRMLAYSSVEHVGIMALGFGIGGTLGAYAALLHLVNHAATKAALFFVAGDVVQRFGTRRISAIRGALRAAPLTGWLLLLGIFAITGTPPAGIFISEIAVAGAGIDGDRWRVAATISVMLLLGVIFAGMLAHGLRLAYGTPPREDEVASHGGGLARSWRADVPWLAGVVPLALVVVLFGVYVPGPVSDLFADAVAVLTPVSGTAGR
jgi:hydrogenase-4 component F